jgi:hypothetical protein
MILLVSITLNPPLLIQAGVDYGVHPHGCFTVTFGSPDPTGEINVGYKTRFYNLQFPLLLGEEQGKVILPLLLRRNS